jgi:hypothetical protein
MSVREMIAAQQKAALSKRGFLFSIVQRDPISATRPW